MKTTLRSIGALAAVTVALTGCGTMSVNPVAQFLDDSGTTTAIKTRLATEGSIGSLTGIGVSTRNDVVTLTGTVADDSERQRVEGLARRIAGDNRVISELKVANSASASITTDVAPAPKPVIQKTNQK
jgi:osmotically-inducible protein OsmY